MLEVKKNSRKGKQYHGKDFIYIKFSKVYVQNPSHNEKKIFES